MGGEATWGRFATAAPDLADRIRARFAANLHHVLGTVRPDGAPRLSGSEVEFDDEHVRIGMMPDSHKLADVLRDPRVEIHSAPLEEDLANGDAKLTGRLVEVQAASAEAPPGRFFRLAITRASLVRVEGDELVFATWRPDRGADEIRRR